MFTEPDNGEEKEVGIAKWVIKQVLTKLSTNFKTSQANWKCK